MAAANRILFVDDDPIIREVVSHTLQDYDLLLADNGEDAWQSLRRSELPPVDLLITDLDMPRMDGRDLLYRVRDDELDLSTMVLTADSSLETAVELIQAGALDYLVKPVDTEDLQRKVAKNLAIHDRRLDIAKLNLDRAQRQLEAHQLVNWRQMYASKDSTSVQRMVRLINQVFNSQGGFAWADWIRELGVRDEGQVSVSEELVTMMSTSTAEYQRLLNVIGACEQQFNEALAFQPHRGDAVLGLWGPDVWQEALKRRSHQLAGPKRDLIEHLTFNLHWDSFSKAMRELMINALRHSEAESRITTYAQEMSLNRQPHLKLTLENAVATSGKSTLSSPETELVFDLFYQIETNVAPSGYGEPWGFGTGLPMAREILRRHGGWVTMDTRLSQSDSKRVLASTSVFLPLATV